MFQYLPYIIFLIVIGISIKNSIYGSLEEKSAKYSLDRLIYYFSIFITFLIMIINLEKIYIFILRILSNYPNIQIVNNNLIKVLILGVLFYLAQSILYYLLKGLTNPLNRAYKYLLSKGKVRIIIFSSIFGLLKGLIIILIIFMGVIAYNSTFGQNKKIDGFSNFNAYKRLESIVLTNKPILSYENFKDDKIVSSNIIVYYNGVTLEEGIKSNSDIDNKAEEIIEGAISDRDKAKRIYSWIGSNIKYDNEKADKVLNNEDIKNSGAIEAYTTKKGICFDYACLYVAMANSVGLKSRIITGDAYDGENVGPHAWNQVFLEDENKWINVDPTFYLSGDYFDNYDFYNDHLNSELAGEW